MKIAILAAVGASIIVMAGYSSAAEARCLRIGHHWSCGHHRLHYGHRALLARGYGYTHPYYYGSSYPYYGSSSNASTMGPRPNGGGGP